MIVSTNGNIDCKPPTAKPNQYVVVAENTQGELLGFICAYGAFDLKVGTLIDSLHAHPEHKRSGIGKYLLTHVAMWNKKNYPDNLLILSKN